MNITVIGASTGTGLEVVKRAIDRNHSVTALSRSKLHLVNSKSVQSIQGDALNKYVLKKSIEHADAVLVTLGTGTNLKSTTLYSDFAKIIVELQKEAKLEVPIIIISGFGIGESLKHVSWFVKMFLKYKLKEVMADKAIMEEIICASDLNWIFVRPGCLKDGPLTESYRTETSLFKGINIANINRPDVADFMVKQAENPCDMKKFVGITEN